MEAQIDRAIALVWILVGAFWAVTAVSGKRAVRREPGASRIYHVFVMTVAFALLFRREVGIWQFGHNIVPPSAAALYTGLALTCIGAGFAVWARAVLGSNWSAIVSVKENHSFVNTGPYHLVRHPIYTGLLVAMLGTAFVYGRVACFVGIAFAFVGWWLKARMEEEFMVQRFGEEYRVYQRHVKQLIPFVL
jgi:protein-S-isoprenylcysteine O-methyltransferase